MLLQGKVALGTGGNRGGGDGPAKLRARHGAAVAVNYFRSAQAARKVVSEIEPEGGTAIAVKADVRNMDRTEAMVRKVTAALGPIDTIVLNASISFPVGPLLAFRWGEFQATLVGGARAA